MNNGTLPAPREKLAPPRVDELPCESGGTNWWRHWRLRLDRPLRRMLPRSLLGRSLLIVLIPLVVTQGISLELFYGSHLDIVSRRLSGAVAGEINQTLLLLERYRRAGDREWIINAAAEQFQLDMHIQPHVRMTSTGSTRWASFSV